MSVVVVVVVLVVTIEVVTSLDFVTHVVVYVLDCGGEDWDDGLGGIYVGAEIM